MPITFSTLIIPPFWEKETLLLVESLRENGAHLADQPFIVLTLRGNPLSPAAEKTLELLDVTRAEFEMDEEARKFPLAVVPYGAAAAEKATLEAGAASKTNLLVWLLPDTLILNPPEHFALPENARVGYRPVHHQNVGSGYGQVIDTFWQQIYTHCQVPDEHIFQMDTCYRESVRPYFNAGMLVCRPQEALLQAWLETFQLTYRHPDFTPAYEQPKYAVFMHQAVLAGILLHRYRPDQLLELPESYNYPLHMHADYPAEYRIHALEELKTARYENTNELAEYLHSFDSAKSDWAKNKLNTLLEKYEQS